MGRLEETISKSSDYLDVDSPRWPQVVQSHIDWSSQRGSEPATL